MKKFYVFLTACVMVGVLAGCSKKSAEPSAKMDWNEHAVVENNEDKGSDEDVLSDTETDSDENNSENIEDDDSEDGESASAVEILEEYIKSDEFVYSPNQISELSVKLNDMVEDGLIMDGFSFNSSSGGYDFATKGGKLYTVSSIGVVPR